LIYSSSLNEKLITVSKFNLKLENKSLETEEQLKELNNQLNNQNLLFKFKDEKVQKNNIKVIFI
jgi:hypothetical protein